jgi:cyanophycin synthetase
MITLYDKGSHIPLLWTHLIPATLEGRATHNVQNAMFAAAMAYAMGVKLDDIRTGLRTFDASYFQTPGRMNVFDGLGFKVILDYGHNPAAVAAMCTFVDNLTAGTTQRDGSRRVVALACPGDRRDEDIKAIAVRAARTFDHFVCKRDDNRRGRGHDEVPQLMRGFLIEAGVSPDAIDVVPEEPDAVEHALGLCRPGDVLLVFGDQITRTWKQIIYHGGRRPEPTPAAAPVVAEEAAPAELPGVARDERGVFLAVDEEAD